MSDPNQVNEIELLQRINAGDQQALSTFYQQFANLVYGLAMRVAQNPTLAEEITQDTFLKVWNQAHRWDPERGSVTTWLMTITRYTAIDRLRKEKSRAPWTAIDLDDVLGFLGKDSPFDDPAWHDGRLIRSLIQQLPPDQQQALELSFFSALSHTEIAEQLQLPLGTVKSRVRRGLQNLRDLWQDATR